MRCHISGMGGGVALQPKQPQPQSDTTAEELALDLNKGKPVIPNGSARSLKTHSCLNAHLSIKTSSSTTLSNKGQAIVNRKYKSLVYIYYILTLLQI